jgi:hypothetical protein
VPAFLDTKSSSGACGASAGNYAPYKAVCTSCEARLQGFTDANNRNNNKGTIPKYVFSMPAMPADNNPVASPADCMAMCNPDLFHSYTEAERGGVPLAAPVRFQSLRCELCSTNEALPCRVSLPSQW